MRIHFFTKREPSAGSSRQRAFLVADWLNKKGVEAVMHRPSAATISETRWPGKARLIWKHLVELKDVKKGDILFLQRPLGNKYLIVMLVAYVWIFRTRTFFDMDDSVFVYMPRKVKFFTRMCDEIIVGSHFLAEWAKPYNSHIHIIPTSVDFDKYQAYTRNYAVPTEKFTIGWIGGANYHFENLKLMVPVFQELVRRSIPVKFVLIGASSNKAVYEMFQGIEGLDVQLIDALDWTDPKAVPSAIQGFDIGLMPLVDNDTARGKCAFKAIEYMACGVVPVISPVGENGYLVQDGFNGFMAKDTAAWVEKIVQIYENRDLCFEMGKNAQRTIKERYSFDANVDKLIELFKKA